MDESQPVKPDTRPFVVRDTREHENQGWFWAPSDVFAGTETRKLDTGDYSLAGFEHTIAVERKKSVSELAGCIWKPRFEAELERFQSFAVPVVVLEFTLEELYAYPAQMPAKVRRKIRARGPALACRLQELMVRYKTQFVPAGSKGRDFVTGLFKRFLESQRG